MLDMANKDGIGKLPFFLSLFAIPFRIRGHIQSGERQEDRERKTTEYIYVFIPWIWDADCSFMIYTYKKYIMPVTFISIHVVSSQTVLL